MQNNFLFLSGNYTGTDKQADGWTDSHTDSHSLAWEVCRQMKCEYLSAIITFLGFPLAKERCSLMVVQSGTVRCSTNRNRVINLFMALKSITTLKSCLIYLSFSFFFLFFCRSMLVLNGRTQDIKMLRLLLLLLLTTFDTILFMAY